MIGGFIIGGNGGASGKVIMRAIGPSLSNSGVPQPLQDPTLELHNGNGTLLASNDDWRDTQQSEIQATGLAPSNEKESAIVATLPDGGYTAIVRGKNNGTGVGLVEVYNLHRPRFDRRIRACHALVSMAGLRKGALECGGKRSATPP